MLLVVHQQDLHNPRSPENLRAAKPSPLPFVPISVMLASGMDRSKPYGVVLLCSASACFVRERVCMFVYKHVHVTRALQDLQPRIDLVVK